MLLVLLLMHARSVKTIDICMFPIFEMKSSKVFRNISINISNNVMRAMGCGEISKVKKNAIRHGRKKDEIKYLSFNLGGKAFKNLYQDQPFV